jgi:mRNA-degrading endonuclease RelE of RelBE toxin-antitoxin system
MYQVTFSDQSMAELNKLDKLVQIEVIEPLGDLNATMLAHPREPLGRFTRGDKTFYRLRSGEHRIYFTVKGDTLHTHYILHRNSLTDFVFRTKLPITEEQLVEQHTSFWKYLETLGK